MTPEEFDRDIEAELKNLRTEDVFLPENFIDIKNAALEVVNDLHIEDAKFLTIQVLACFIHIHEISLEKNKLYQILEEIRDG